MTLSLRQVNYAQVVDMDSWYISKQINFIYRATKININVLYSILYGRDTTVF